MQVLAWLKCKVQRTVDALRSEGNQYKGLDLQGLQRYSIGILGEYLSNEFSNDLIKSFNLPALGKLATP